MEGRHQSRINDETRPSAAENAVSLLRELVAHLRQRRTDLRQEWARRIHDARLLTASWFQRRLARALQAALVTFLSAGH